jgi:hypothetical protein
MRKTLLTLSALILLIGYAAAGWLAWRVGGESNGLIPIPVPGGATVALGAPGPWTLYHEYEGIVDGAYYFHPPIPEGLEVRLTDAATSRPIALDPAPADAPRYFFGARKGAAMAVPMIDPPATLTLRADFAPGVAGDRTVLAFGTPQVQRVRNRVLLVQLLVLAVTLAAGGLGLAGALRRS